MRDPECRVPRALLFIAQGFRSCGCDLAYLYPNDASTEGFSPKLGFRRAGYSREAGRDVALLCQSLGASKGNAADLEHACSPRAAHGGCSRTRCAAPKTSIGPAIILFSFAHLLLQAVGNKCAPRPLDRDLPKSVCSLSATCPKAKARRAGVVMLRRSVRGVPGGFPDEPRL